LQSENVFIKKVFRFQGVASRTPPFVVT